VAVNAEPPANHEPTEAIPAPRKVTAEPDDTEPASAFLREYRKPSRMTKPATAGGALLRRWRQGEGLTQREAAKRLGIAQSTYSAVETGRRQPTKPQAAKLAEVAGITAADWTTPADGEG
jgi:DNA-binding XRE family transcriptional regulator